MDVNVRRRLTALAVCALSASFAACSAAGDPRARATGNESGAGAAAGAGGAGGGGAGGGDAGPLGPDASCGYAKIAVAREPSAVLLVIDRSFSMSEDADGEYPPKFGEPPKWELAKSALQSVLGSLPDDLGVGLLLYPNAKDACAVAAEPQVSIAPLGQTRQVILSYLGSPFGDTPTADALTAAYAHAGALGGAGKKAVLLVTDGAWDCGSDSDAIYTSAKAAQSGPGGVLTFAVGAPGSSLAGLSRLAHEGGTDRVPDCLVDCGADTQKQCCHYPTGAETFGDDLPAALGEIATQVAQSCVFAVPKGEEPAKFDPALVNLVLTEDGKPPAFVPKAPFDGWGWVGGGDEAVEVRGPYCDKIAAGGAQVEVLLGCPSVAP